METESAPIPGQWAHLDRILLRSGPLANPAYSPSPEVLSFIQNDCKVLVIGAGGLGSEVLKNLALSGFRHIHVIDMDTIDISNLNRQFLFRKSDVGQSKALVAARFVNARVPGVNVVAHHNKIQDFGSEFYRQFNFVIGGLDSIDARRWMNATLAGLIRYDEDGDIVQESIIPYIDGGTEGFKGQARVILPRISSCFECSLDSFPPQVTYPLCTIADKPRKPEHCIEWASVVQWPIEHPNEKLDTDNPEHCRWLFDTATKRAQKYDIQGVTFMLTMGVVKNIIPAIASTNAIIAASCVNEAFKLASQSAPLINNYMQFNGSTGIYFYTFSYEKKPECPVCGGDIYSVSCSPDETLGTFIGHLAEDSRFQFKSPSIRGDGKSLYMRMVPQLEESTRPNLDKKMKDLVEENETLYVIDPVLPNSVIVKIRINLKE